MTMRVGWFISIISILCTKLAAQTPPVQAMNVWLVTRRRLSRRLRMGTCEATRSNSLRREDGGSEDTECLSCLPQGQIRAVGDGSFKKLVECSAVADELMRRKSAGLSEQETQLSQIATRHPHFFAHLSLLTKC